MEKRGPATFGEYFGNQIRNLTEWVKPEPKDNFFLKVVKLILKMIVLLILLALSPIIIFILVVAFFTAF